MFNTLIQRVQQGLQKLPALLENWAGAWDSVSISFGHNSRIPRPVLALGGMALLGLLMLWNAKLVLAVVVGLGTMAAAYWLPRRDWSPAIAALARPRFSGSQRLLLLCVGSGGVAMVGTYMGASIWEHFQDGWLVACLFFQGLAIFGLLGLWLGSERGRSLNPATSPAISLDAALMALAQPEPLQRLLAVRQLHRLGQQQHFSPQEQRTVHQALQLLLLQEPEAAVREAALRSLAPSLMAPNPMTSQTSPTPGAIPNER